MNLPEAAYTLAQEQSFAWIQSSLKKMVMEVNSHNVKNL